MSDEKVTDSPTWPEAIRAAIASMLGDVHVGLPGRIESWDPATQRADVKPLIKRVFYTAERERVVEELPCIPNVPVLFPRTTTMFMSWPLKIGDHVELRFTERSIDQFMEKKGVDTDPLDVRRFDLSDAVARVGFYPDSKQLADVHPDNLVIGKDGGTQMHFKPNNEIHFSDSGDGIGAEFLALAQKTFDQINALRSAVDALTTVYNAHSVSVTVPALGLLDSLGAPVTGVATGTSVAPGDASAPPSVNSVASSIVKAD